MPRISQLSRTQHSVANYTTIEQYAVESIPMYYFDMIETEDSDVIHDRLF